MIVCPNCGAENALGRVFCMNCGGKLALGNMSKESIDDLQGGWFLKHWKIIAAVTGGVVLLFVFLTLWPNAKILGESGNNAEAMWMRSNLNRIERIREGQYTMLLLSEKRFNGYFAGGRAGELGLASLSAELGENSFTIKGVKQFVSFKIKGIGLDLGLSLQTKWNIVDGVPTISSGSIGHIPLPGPLGKLPGKILASMIKDSKEYTAAKLVKKTELQRGQLSVRLEK